ncbi:Tc toxin subunit A [Myxococcota bacterium]|nr:Tc toxin subunit A [Myxococcota bacterium]
MTSLLQPRVYGYISRSDQNPAQVWVRVYDRKLREERLLGETSTTALGLYEISYELAGFSAHEEGIADLVVRVFQTETSPSPLISSETHFRASYNERIDLQIPQVPTLSMFSFLEQKAQPFLTEASLAGPQFLLDDDLSFLSGRLGLAASTFEAWRWSYQQDLSGVSIPPMCFYAWSQQGLPQTLSVLLQQSPQELEFTLRQAVAQQQIPSEIVEQIPALMSGLLPVQINSLLNEPNKPEVAAIVGFMEWIEVGIADREIFAQTYLQHQTLGDALWLDLQENPEFRGDLEVLQFASILQGVCESKLQLLEQVWTEHAQNLVEMAQMNVQQWRDCLVFAELPSSISDVLVVMDRVEDTVPTLFVAHQMVLEDANFSQVFASILDPNATDLFSLKTSYLEQVFTEHPQLFDGLANATSLQQQLKATQRLYKLIPRYRHAKQLLDDGLHSAQTVSQLGQNTFVSRYAEDLGSEALALEVYQRAESITETSYLLLGQFHETLTNQRLPSVSSGIPTPPVEIPNWSSLFGHFDLCACASCQSMTSPAAYFTDLLHFFSFRKNSPSSPSAEEVLLSRRPDLGEIELSCQNTHTKMLAIDLLNEVLEDLLVPPPAFSPPSSVASNSDLLGTLGQSKLPSSLVSAFGLDERDLVEVVVPKTTWRIHTSAFSYLLEHDSDAGTLQLTKRSRQTYGEESALRIHPSYLNTNAYAQMKASNYPWDGCFDLWEETSRVFLQRLVVQHHELRQAFQEPIQDLSCHFLFTQEQTARSYLKINEYEALILQGTSGAALFELWGLESAGDVDSLDNLAILLERSGISYQKLQDLLQTRTLNPTRSISIVGQDPNDPNDLDDPATCDLAKLYLAGYSQAFAAKFVRFVRLQRKLSWTARELDLALEIFAPQLPEAQATLFQELACVDFLSKRLKLSVEEVCLFWGDFSLEGEKTLYHKLFLEPSQSYPLAISFSPVVTVSSLQPSFHTTTLSVLDALSQATLLRSLHLQEDELLLIFPNGSPQATNTTLSTLARLGILARSLGLSATSLLQLKDLLGLDPFDTNDLHQAMRFVYVAETLRELGISVDAFRYLARGEGFAFFGIRDEEVANFLQPLRLALRAVNEAYTLGEMEHRAVVQSGREQLVSLMWSSRFVDRLLQHLDDQAAYHVSLAELPAGYVFPATLQEQIHYSTDTQTLSFQGVMSASQKAILDASTSNNPLLNAFQVLYNSARDLVLPWLAHLEPPDCSVALSSLPSFTIPRLYQERFFYPIGTQRLHFIGWMEENERDELLSLHADVGYQAAVQSLYTASHQAPNPAFYTTSEGEALLEEEKEVRLRSFVEKVFAWGRQKQARATVLQQTSQAFSLELDVTKTLLSVLPSVSPEVQSVLETLSGSRLPQSHDTLAWTESNFDVLFQDVRNIARFTLFIRHLKLTNPSAQMFLTHGESKGWFSFSPQSSLSLWLSVPNGLALTSLQSSISSKGLEEIWGVAFAENTTKAAIHAVLVRVIGLTTNDLMELDAAFSLVLSSYQAPEVLERLQRCARLLASLGVSAQTALSWSLTLSEMETANAIKQAVRERFGDERWAEIATPLQDQLREQQRDALVSHLLASPHKDAQQQPLWHHIEGLYAYLLMDPQISPCFQTSRLKHAISSVQLFGQRCLLGLESQVTADSQQDDQWEQWPWMKNYRLWEANRKVFLYPENWIEPELRPDKSAFFEELESELLQSEITQQSAEDALRRYLEKLDQVARLEIVAFYHQRDARPRTDILHVFGRTPSHPHAHYYRQRTTEGRWLPWERLDLDIQSEHLLPVFWNQRLCLFWPTFAAMPTAPKEPASNNGLTSKYWEVEFQWSERSGKTWGPARKANEKLVLLQESGTAQPGSFDPQSYVFYVEPDGIDLAILYAHRQYALKYDIYALLLTPNGSSFRKKKTFNLSQSPLNFRNFPNTREYANRLIEDLYDPSSEGWSASVVTSTAKGKPVEMRKTSEERRQNSSPFVLFQRTSQVGRPPYQLVFGADQFLYDASPRVQGFLFDAPVFFQDDRCTFLLTPKQSLSYTSTRDENNQPITFENIEKEGYQLDFFYHPWSKLFLRELRARGLKGLFHRELQSTPTSYPHTEVLDVVASYTPTKRLVTKDAFGDPLSFDEEVSFRREDVYAFYNWELFFHAPLLIAEQLRRNQRFAEAQAWYHAIFRPTDSSGFSAPSRYWQTKAFFEESSGTPNFSIQSLLQQFAQGKSLPALENQIKQWRANPYQPHLIAELRTSAYMKTVVMKYIDNLLDWGDQLFRQETIESLNEAAQLYILASELLGPRPQVLPPQNKPQTQTYNSIKPSLDAFSNAMVEIEHLVPYQETIPQNGSVASSFVQSKTRSPMPSLPKVLSFCLPINEHLAGYWDRLEDRLFKLRHCMDLEGRVRQLPLFAPPIDPSILVRAAATGVDIGEALHDTHAALAPYRFVFLLGKAQSLCAEVRQLGEKILSSLEKKDAEELSLLRANQEKQSLERYRQVRQLQVEEAKTALESLQKTRDVIQARLDYYQSLEKISPNERTNVEKLKQAQEYSSIAQYIQMGISILHAFPNFTFEVGLSPTFASTWGGSNIGSSAQAVATFFQAQASHASHEAAMASIEGGHQRRWEEWKQQEKLAEKELAQVEKQIAAADLRLAIVEKELEQHERQIKNAETIEAFLQDKYTNKELYRWMTGQLSNLYFQTYQLAYEMSKRAERAYHFEVETQEKMVQFGHWDHLKQGLLSGERLAHDLHRMESRYLEQHKRTFELTKRISLASLSPAALLQLKQEGACWIELPEVLFDLDFPGHFMRRIKTLQVTIPCVTGPYTQVNATLTLHKHTIRHRKDSTGDYARQSEEDARFTDRFEVTSIAISRGQEDGGMFETNLRDERYLPFEGAGVISRWRLEMPTPYRAFDYNSISDVVLTLLYTARDGGELLKQKALASLDASVNAIAQAIQESGMLRSLSLKQEAGTAFHAFLHTPLSGNMAHNTTFSIGREHFPHLFQHKELLLKRVSLLVAFRDKEAGQLGSSLFTLRLARTAEGNGQSIALTQTSGLAGLPVLLQHKRHGDCGLTPTLCPRCRVPSSPQKGNSNPKWSKISSFCFTTRSTPQIKRPKS